MDPITPETPSGSVARKTLKIHLTPEQAAQVKTSAHQHELSQSEYGRFRLLGKTSYKLPDASKLEAIARQLAGIGSNLNQCQKSINEAQSNGTLTAEQFAAMHAAISAGLKAWADPLNELRDELKKLKPAKTDSRTRDKLDAADQ